MYYFSQRNDWVNYHWLKPAILPLVCSTDPGQTGSGIMKQTKEQLRIKAREINPRECCWWKTCFHYVNSHNNTRCKECYRNNIVNRHDKRYDNYKTLSEGVKNERNRPKRNA